MLKGKKTGSGATKAKEMAGDGSGAAAGGGKEARPSAYMQGIGMLCFCSSRHEQKFSFLLPQLNAYEEARKKRVNIVQAKAKGLGIGGAAQVTF